MISVGRCCGCRARCVLWEVSREVSGAQGVRCVRRREDEVSVHGCLVPADGRCGGTRDAFDTVDYSTLTRRSITT